MVWMIIVIVNSQSQVLTAEEIKSYLQTYYSKSKVNLIK